MLCFITGFIGRFSAFSVQRIPFCLCIHNLPFLPVFFELQVIILIENMEKPTNATKVFSVLKTINNYFHCALLRCLMFLFHFSDIVLFLPMQISHTDWLPQYFMQKKSNALLYYFGGSHLPHPFSIKYWSCSALMAEDNQDFLLNVLNKKKEVQKKNN